MAKIKLDLTDLSVTDLIQMLNNIHTAMTGNATFTSIAAKTTALGTATTALETANDDAEAAMEAFSWAKKAQAQAQEAYKAEQEQAVRQQPHRFLQAQTALDFLQAPDHFPVISRIYDFLLKDFLFISFECLHLVALFKC